MVTANIHDGIEQRRRAVNVWLSIAIWGLFISFIAVCWLAIDTNIAEVRDIIIPSALQGNKTRSVPVVGIYYYSHPFMIVSWLITKIQMTIGFGFIIYFAVTFVISLWSFRTARGMVIFWFAVMFAFPYSPPFHDMPIVLAKPEAAEKIYISRSTSSEKSVQRENIKHSLRFVKAQLEWSSGQTEAAMKTSLNIDIDELYDERPFLHDRLAIISGDVRGTKPICFLWGLCVSQHAVWPIKFFAASIAIASLIFFIFVIWLRSDLRARSVSIERRIAISMHRHSPKLPVEFGEIA